MNKKYFLLVALFVLALGLAACNGNTDKTTTTEKETTQTTETNETTEDTTPAEDTNPPAFYGAVNGKLSTLEQLEGDEIDVLADIQVIDNVTPSKDIKLSVEWNDYDKDKPGEYTITIRATDEAGNYSEVERTIIVLEAIERKFDALVHGDAFVEIYFNSEDALKINDPAFGINARRIDVVQVMDKDFFLQQVDANKADYADNGGVPYLPYGAMAILDKEMNVKLFRTDIGNMFEVTADNKMSYQDLSWGREKNAEKPGGVLAGIEGLIEDLISEGGYVLFTGSPDDQNGRTFLTNQLFGSNYGGGAGNKELWDRDVREVKFEIVRDFVQKIAVPDKLPAPVINIERHILSWEPIENAKEYEIYVDGELQLTTTSTSVPMLNLDLEVTPEDGEPYKIYVVAVTRDMFQWSTSDASNVVEYTQLEVTKLDAPDIELDGTVIRWEANEKAVEYKVVITIAGKVVKEVTVSETSFDLSQFESEFPGNVSAHVVALGDNQVNLDSDASNSVIAFLGEVQTFEVNGFKTEIIVTPAYNYFLRRNANYSTDPTGFASAPYLFLVTNIQDIKADDFDATANEAFSVVVLLDANGKPKVVNNILAGQTWSREKGWHTDEFYANSNAQIVNLLPYIEDGDQLLIGKNGNTLQVTSGEEVITAVARELLAYIYINPWDSFPTAPVSDGWRAGIDNFTVNPLDVVYTITTETEE